MTEPIRKSILPTTPPPEWEFSSVLGAPHGCALLPGDTGPVVVRRRVSYGDWEPVRPDRWADEPAARQATPVGPCGCGAPATPNVIHRQGAPCYMDQDGGLQTVELPTATARQTTGQDDTKPAPWTADGRHGPTPDEAAAFLRFMATQHPAVTHCCTNCDGIDPDTCLTNPHRAPAVGQPVKVRVVSTRPEPVALTNDAQDLVQAAVGQPAEAHDTEQHRPPCTNGDHCGEPSHCPPSPTYERLQAIAAKTNRQMAGATLRAYKRVYQLARNATGPIEPSDILDALKDPKPDPAKLLAAIMSDTVEDER